jgi:hypothetical protein
MPIELVDPTNEVRNRGRQIITADDNRPLIDAKELAERQDAAKAYAGENEKHFVDYCHECVKESIKASDDIRRAQDDCWRVYNEKEPESYSLSLIHI